MSGPRTKRQSAGAASDPAQRQIHEFFKPSPRAITSQSDLSPPLPGPVQVHATTPVVMAAALRAESDRSDSSSDLSSAEPSCSQFITRKRLQSSANTTPSSCVRYAPDEPEEKKPKPLPTRRYRDSTEAPDDFKEQTQIALEERLYHTAIQSLQINLSSQSYLPADAPLWVAPPAHMAFLGTLAIHPLHTTWAQDDAGKNKKIVAVRAYQYLLDVLRSVGPVNGHFKTAFAFRDRGARARAGRRRRHHSPGGSDVGQEDDLKTPLANEDSLWARVPDFWNMLGWAFSCAASHPERWVHWRLWVELLLDLMERDLQERRAMDEERGDGNPRMLRESIIMSYIGEHQLGHIMRVLFAYVDGTPHSYQEVWPNETQVPAATNKRKRDAKVDLEHGEYGDWFEEDEDGSFRDEEPNDANTSQPTTPARKKGKGKGRGRKKQPLPLVEHPLLEETIPLRRRIFALVSQICHDLPSGDAPFAIFDLYERAAEHIRGLPLDAFPHFLWSDMPVVGTTYVTLARHVLSYLLPPGVPQPIDVDKETEVNGYVSAVMMERCFLPHATNSVVEDNARLAVVLWELFSYLWRAEDCELGPRIGDEMRRAILVGLEERERKSRLVKEGPLGDEPDWVEETMGVIERDRYAPANVLRLAHAKFRLLLEKSAEREALLGGERLEADFLGWK